MSDLDRVFIVTFGEYSDYYISSVWSTREAAELAAGSSGFVEEWLLNTTEEREIIEWRAWIDQRDGSIRVADRPVATNHVGHTQVERPRSSRLMRQQMGHRAEWSGEGYGPSPEHARKALADALAKAKSEALMSDE